MKIVDCDLSRATSESTVLVEESSALQVETARLAGQLEKTLKQARRNRNTSLSNNALLSRK